MAEFDTRLSLPPKSSNPVRQEVDGSFNPTRLFNLINRQHWTGAEQFLVNEPVEASIWIFSGKERRWEYLPLHIVCMNWNKGRSDGDVKSETLSLIKALLQAYPEGAGLADHDGNHPIHLAMQSEAPVEILSSLFIAFPDAIKMQDSFGKTPIERILSFNDKQVGLDLINMLMQSSVVFNRKNMEMKKENEKMKADLIETRDELTEFRGETIRLSKQNVNFKQQLQIEKRMIKKTNGREGITSSAHIDRAEDEREIEEYQDGRVYDCDSAIPNPPAQDFSETKEYKDMATTIENLNNHIIELTDQFQKNLAEKNAQHAETVSKMEIETKHNMTQVLTSLKKSYDEEKLFWNNAHISVKQECDDFKAANLALEKRNHDLESKMIDFEQLQSQLQIHDQEDNDLQESIKNLMKAKETAMKTLSQTKEDLDDTTLKLNQSEVARKSVEEKNIKLETTLESIRTQMITNQMSNLKVKSNLEENVKNLNEKLDNLNNDMEEQKKSNKNVLKSITSRLQSRITTLENELKLSEKARESCSSLNSNLTNHLNKVLKGNNILEVKEKTFVDQLKVLEDVKSELTDVRKEKNVLLDSVKIKETRIDEYELQVKALKENLTDLENKYKIMLQESTLVKNQLKTRAETVGNDNLLMLQRYEELAEKLKTTKAQMQVENEEKNEVLKKLKESELAFSDQSREVQNLKEKLKQIQIVLAKKKEYIKGAQHELETANRNKKVAERTIEMMNERISELSKKDETVQFYSENIKTLEKSNQDAKTQISELTKKLASYAMATSSLSKNLTKLRKDNEQLEQKLQTCEKIKADTVEKLRNANALVTEITTESESMNRNKKKMTDDKKLDQDIGICTSTFEDSPSSVKMSFVEKSEEELLKKEHELSETKKKLAVLQKKLENTARSKKVVDEVVKSLTERVGVLSDDLNKVKTEKESLQSRYNHQSKVTVELRTSLVNFRASGMNLNSLAREDGEP